MRKPKSLRKTLEAALPEIRNEPGRMAIWIEDGAVRCTQTEGAGFTFRYPLSVVLTELRTDISVVALAICRWLRVNQPDLLVPNTDSFTFETDVLDNETADLMFTITLCENVQVTPNEDGSHQIDYLAEPDPLFDDGVSVTDPAAAPPLAEVRTTADIVTD